MESSSSDKAGVLYNTRSSLFNSLQNPVRAILRCMGFGLMTPPEELSSSETKRSDESSYCSAGGPKQNAGNPPNPASSADSTRTQTSEYVEFTTEARVERPPIKGGSGPGIN